MDAAFAFIALRDRLQLTNQELAELSGVQVSVVDSWVKGIGVPSPYTIDILQRACRSMAKGKKESAQKVTFVDLFAGIGGMRMAFDAAGGKCVYTNEWNKYAAKTYSSNFQSSHEVDCRDIRSVDLDEMPDHDVLVAGFPCQPFSIAGVSKKNALGRPHGFMCDTQGTLFYDVARILTHRRPKAFLLENVRNLVSHDRGQTFATIINVLQNELGYSVQWRIVDAGGFVPQHRERIFIVGFRNPAALDLDELDFGDPLKGPRLDAVLHTENGSEPAEEPYTVGPKARVAEKYRLTDHLWGYLQKYAEKHRRQGNGFGFGLVGPADVARTLSARYFKDGSEILVKTKGNTPRRLTPRECARLMGFDRQGQATFRIPVSDTQAYKQFGNSVVVPVVEVFAKAIVGELSVTGSRPRRMQPRDLLEFSQSEDRPYG